MAACETLRSSRAVSSWKRRVPGAQRLPLPKAAVLAIAGVLCYRGLPRMAIWIALSFVAYLRPKETFRPRSDHLVAPCPTAGPQYTHWGVLINDSGGEAGKTGEWDGSVTVDLDCWLLDALAALKAATVQSPSLWDFSAGALRKEFNAAVELLGLQSLNPNLYSLRHGGASDDLSARRRTLAEVERRGQWRDQRSLRRYGKETRLLMEMGKVSPAVFTFGQLVQDHFSVAISSRLRDRRLWTRIPLGIRTCLERTAPDAGAAPAAAAPASKRRRAR